MCFIKKEQIMKHLYLVLTGIIVASLIACGKNSPTGGVSSAGGSHGQNPGGTIDGGGGNGIGGNPVERFKVDITKLPEFKILEPILKKIDEVDANVNLRLEYVIAKNWYIVPISLQGLASAKTGLYFSTDQIALHTFKEIWISDQHYNNQESSPEDKATLLLHEIIMGLKVLKFASYYEQCLSGTLMIKMDGNPEWAHEYCSSGLTKEGMESKKIELTSKDHAEVRALTSYLMNPETQLTKTGLLQKLFDLNFSNERHNYEEEIPSKKITLNQLKSRIDEINRTQKTLYRNSAKGGTATEKCYISYEQTQDNQFKLSVVSGKTSYSVTAIDDEIRNHSYRLRTDKFGMVSTYTLNYGSLAEGVQQVEILMSEDRIIGFSAQTLTLKYKDDSKQSWGARELENFFCSVSKNLSESDRGVLIDSQHDEDFN